MDMCESGEMPEMVLPEPGKRLTGNRKTVQAAEKDSIVEAVVREIDPYPY